MLKGSSLLFGSSLKSALTFPKTWLSSQIAKFLQTFVVPDNLFAQPIQATENSVNDSVAKLGKFDLEIQLPGQTSTTILDYIWLRDNCKCPLCVEPIGKGKLLQIHEIDINIKPKSVRVQDLQLTIEWPDGHKSSYALDWLSSNLYHPKRLHQKISLTLWNSSLKHEEFPRVTFEEYMNTQDGFRTSLKLLFQKGFLLVEGTPATLEVIKQITEKLGFLKNTIFGEGMYIVQCDANSTNDSSYHIIPHKDTCYFPETYGLQVFHCLEGAESETILIDGFNVANEVKFRNPEHYEILSNSVIEYNFKMENQYDYLIASTILHHHPFSKELEQVRFNLMNISPVRTLPPTEIRRFYCALIDFAKEMFSAQNQIKISMNPGTVLIIDNLRVLHDRTGFTENRTLCGAFVGRHDWLSKARINDVL